MNISAKSPKSFYRLFNLSRLSLFCLLVMALVPQQSYALPTPIDLPTSDGSLLAKAAPDECYDGIGVDYPDGPPCSSGKPKVNQAYIWGLAKAGNQLWLGTMANTQCLVVGGYLGVSGAFETPSYVCEFGQSEIRRNGLPPIPANTVPEEIGDFRPPRIYVYDTSVGTLTEKVPTGGAAALLSTTLGLRAAGTLDDVVLLAGPGLDGQLRMFAYRASTGAFLGVTTLANYTNIRKFAVVDGTLYAGVGTNEASPAKSGRVLRWQGSVADPFNFVEVGIIDSMASEIAEHEGKLFVTSWPAGEFTGGGGEAGLYMSPAIPTGGFVAPATEWTKVWSVSDYEADPVTAATYGGGALASFQGHLYWGTMHVPLLSTLAHFTTYGSPADPEQQAAWALNSARAISIFRGQNFGSPGENLEIVYGYAQMQAYDPGTSSWQNVANKMGKMPLWGGAGFNNPGNNYTWTMSVYDDRLWVGTMDWSWLLSEGLTGALPGGGGLSQLSLPGLTTLGADLWYFPSANSPAYPESLDGVGNPSSYGIRTMVSEPGGLYLGMANPMNLLTNPDTGPLGGWELIQLNAKPPNTPPGDSVVVPLEQGASIRFCHIDAAGFTFSRHIPLEGVAIPLPNGSLLNNALLIASTADWREGCPGAGLASLTIPIDSLHQPRMLQLLWDQDAGRLVWQDITLQASAQSITGTINARFMGVVVVVSTPIPTPVPALSPLSMVLLMLAMAGLAGRFMAKPASR